MWGLSVTPVKIDGFAPPFNRIKFIALAVSVVTISLIMRGKTDPNGVTVMLSQLGDVLGRFGVRAEDVPFEDPGQANVSLPVESMEILRQTNRALGRLPESEAKEELRKGLKNTVTVHAYGAEKLRASPAQRARIEAFYAESNRAMNTRWGTELPVPA